MKKLILFSITLLAFSCTPKSEEGERNSGSVEYKPQSGQPASDSTADNTSGNGSEMTPSDNTQENQGSETSGAGGQ